MVGVVRGPGSFTGVRVGLAAAKGICEATGAKLMAMSRLEMLERVGAGKVAVLAAGRGEFYVRVDGRESVMGLEAAREKVGGAVVVTADADVVVALDGVATVEVVRFEAGSAVDSGGADGGGEV